MRYKGIRLGVCLLALYGMAPVLGVGYDPKVARTEPILFGGSQTGEAIDVGFVSDVQQNRSLQAADSAAGASYHRGASFEGDPRLGVGGRTDKVEWPGAAGTSAAASPYLVSYSPNDAALRRTMSIFCTDYNLCIEYTPSAPPLGNWQGNLAPLDGSYLTAKTFGWTYGDVLMGNASPSVNAGAGGAAIIPPEPSPSNVLARDAGLVSSAAAMGSSLSGGNASLLNAPNTGAVIDSYQGTNSRALANSISSEHNSWATDPRPLGGPIVSPLTTRPLIRRAGLLSSNSTGDDSGFAGNEADSQDSAPVNYWPVVTFGTTSDIPAPEPWPLEFHTPDPVYLFPSASGTGSTSPETDSVLDPPSPVPEPSQLLLMFTVIALTALAAKRAAFKRRADARPGF